MRGLWPKGRGQAELRRTTSLYKANESIDRCDGCNDDARFAKFGTTNQQAITFSQLCRVSRSQSKFEEVESEIKRCVTLPTQQLPR